MISARGFDMVWVRLAELSWIEGRPVSADTMYKRVGEKIFVTFVT